MCSRSHKFAGNLVEAPGIEARDTDAPSVVKRRENDADRATQDVASRPRFSTCSRAASSDGQSVVAIGAACAALRVPTYISQSAECPLLPRWRQIVNAMRAPAELLHQTRCSLCRQFVDQQLS